MTKWTNEQDKAGKLQGWAIFSTEGTDHPPYELQRIQEDMPEDGCVVLFATDRGAHEFVKRQASQGDALALAALAWLKANSPEEHDTITNAKHEGWE